MLAILVLTGCGASTGTTETASSVTAAESSAASAVSEAENTEASASTASESAAAASGEAGGEGIANPITECGTLEEAEALAGFSVSIPDSVAVYLPEFYCVYDLDSYGSMIEVTYSDGERTVTLRKALHSDKEGWDLSGDYNTYSSIKEIDVAGTTVSMRFLSNMVYVATWTDGEYDYAIDASDGLAEKVMADTIAAVDAISEN